MKEFEKVKRELELLKERLELTKIKLELQNAKENYIEARKQKFFEKFELGYLDPEFSELEAELKPIFEAEVEHGRAYNYK